MLISTTSYQLRCFFYLLGSGFWVRVEITPSKVEIAACESLFAIFWKIAKEMRKSIQMEAVSAIQPSLIKSKAVR